MTGAALYIHFPFCQQRCNYCDFYTVAGHANRIPEYVRALKTEIILRSAEAFWQRRKFETIFFGGGTPSLLSPDQITSLLDTCFESLRFRPQVEITLEANPGSATCEKIAGFRAAGVNRLSLGVQSFDPEELALLDRRHSAQQAIDTALAAHYAGFENLSLDLMFALPNQTPRKWQATLEQARVLEPTHISAYNLTIAAGTPLARAMSSGELEPLTEEQQRQLFDLAITFLTSHQFRHYEISNFGRAGFEARHNIKYWDGSPYLGIGASAHSYDGRRRFWNPANLTPYLDSLSRNRLAEENHEILSREQKIFEFIFLNLRQTRGIDLGEFKKKFRRPLEEFLNGKLEEMKRRGLLLQQGNTLRLSREGLFLCDEICARLTPRIKQKTAKPNS